MRAHFDLPSVQSEVTEGKPPIHVKFEIPYFTVSGIQVSGGDSWGPPWWPQTETSYMRASVFRCLSEANRLRKFYAKILEWLCEFCVISYAIFSHVVVDKKNYAAIVILVSYVPKDVDS